MFSFESIEFLSFRDAIKTGVIAEYDVLEHGFVGKTQGGECFAAAFDDEYIDDMITHIDRTCSLVFIRGEKLARRFAERYGYEISDGYLEYVYSGKHIDIPESGYSIRMLDLSYLDVILENYALADHDYIEDRLSKGKIFGIFASTDNLMGFIGEHYEGAMGMLEIFPEYRRRGLGYILESYMIDRALSSGRTPYCNVALDNSKSIALQAKIGMTRTQLTSWWVDTD